MAELDPIEDLATEAEEIDELVAGLTPEQWALETPAPTWTIAHQVAHLAGMFQLSGLSAAEPVTFTELMNSLGADFDANVHNSLAEFLNDPPEVLTTRWHFERDAAIKQLSVLPLDHLIPWLVRPIPVAVMIKVGMMELFAHAQDIADTLGTRRVHTNRIWHVAEVAVHAWTFGYLARGMVPPAGGFRFELIGPSGHPRTLGSPDAEQEIAGTAVDFCLLATRRRHRDDLDLTAVGPDANAWLDIAQAYRGPAGPGRKPGQFPKG
ncbi:MAG: TIGR03084 family metal-binding protein [Actinophytocola sp.]|uniref:TIGR03084 family metal-binding protein n=1 Tax=Actinophytocola sp. TaxID=1872138 RepID=UPI003C71CF09